MDSGITANYSMGQILQLFFQEPRVEVWNWSVKEIAHLRRIQKKREIYRLTNNDRNTLEENEPTLNKLEEDNNNMNPFCSHDASFDCSDVSNDVHNDVIGNVGQSVSGRKRKYDGGFHFPNEVCSVGSIQKGLIHKSDLEERRTINGKEDRVVREPRKRQKLCDIVKHYFDCKNEVEFSDSSDTEDNETESGEGMDEYKGKMVYVKSSDTLRNSAITDISISINTSKSQGSPASKCGAVTNTRLLIINMAILIINVALKLKMLHQKCHDSSSINTHSYNFLLQDAKNYIKLTKPEVLRVHQMLLTRLSHRDLLQTLFPIVNGILSRMENKHELSRLCVFDVLYAVLEVKPKMDRYCDDFSDSTTSVSDESNEDANEVKTGECSSDGVKETESSDICKAALHAQNVLQKILPKISQHGKTIHSQRNPKCEFSHIFKKAKSDAIQYNRSFKRPSLNVNLNNVSQEEVRHLQTENPKTSAYSPTWINSPKSKIRSDEEYRLVRGILRTNSAGIKCLIPKEGINSPPNAPKKPLRFLYKRKCFAEHKENTHEANSGMKDSEHSPKKQNQTFHNAPVKVLGNAIVKLPSQYRTETSPSYTSLDHCPSASRHTPNRKHTLMKTSNISIIPGRKTHIPGVPRGSDTHKTSGFTGSVTALKAVQVLAIECRKKAQSQINTDTDFKISQIACRRNKAVLSTSPIFAEEIKKEPVESTENMLGRLQCTSNNIAKQKDEIVVLKKEEKERKDDPSHVYSTVLRKTAESVSSVDVGFNNDESCRNNCASNTARENSTGGNKPLHRDRLTCVCCSKPATVACAGCRSRYYCNDICQDGDWRLNHGRICNRHFI